MIVGFTGTRKGMTEFQQQVLEPYLHVDEFHHGMCVGADAIAHGLARWAGTPIIGHPPEDQKLMMRYDPRDFTYIWKPKEYRLRNQNIVHAVDRMIATPWEDEEVLRSGTWMTIRYTRKLGKPLMIIFPDGSVESEGW